MDEQSPTTPTPAQRAIQGLRAQDQRQSGRIGTGVDAIDALSRLNSCTKRLRWWSPALIPGVLQTSLYATAAIRGRVASLADEDVAVRAARRWHANQAWLERMVSGTHYAYFVVGVAAIMNPVGTPRVHREQLRRLQGIQDRFPTRVQIRVLPDELPVGSTEPFALHVLEDGALAGIYETMTGGYYTTRSEDLAVMRLTFNDMISFSYSIEESQQIIEEGITACSERMTELSSPSPRTATPRTASLSLARPDDPSR